MCWGDAGLLLSLPNAGLGNAAIAGGGHGRADGTIRRTSGPPWPSPSRASGSDSGSITATAKLDGNEWVLNGEKIFVTCADRCDVVVVWATVDKKAGKVRHQVLHRGKRTGPASSWRSSSTSWASAPPTPAPLCLTDCRIPKENHPGKRRSQGQPPKGSRAS